MFIKLRLQINKSLKLLSYDLKVSICLIKISSETSILFEAIKIEYRRDIDFYGIYKEIIL